METACASPMPDKGPIFLREMHGAALVLVPHAALGNFNESEITQETSELIHWISGSQPRSIVIDLAQGEYLGSAFLGAIVRLWKRVATTGGRLAMCNVSDKVFQILRVTKLHAVWPIYATRDEALKAVGA